MGTFIRAEKCVIASVLPASLSSGVCGRMQACFVSRLLLSKSLSRYCLALQ